MKKGNQRQEVLFLGLAVGVLLVVVLLLAARSYKSKPAEPAKPADASATAAEPEKAAKAKPAPVPLPAPNRDPFVNRVAPPPAPVAPQQAANAAQPAKKEPPKEQTNLKLTGIMTGSEPMAIIYDGEDPYYVHIGGTVGGYTVVKIAGNRAVLKRGEQQITLEMKQEKKHGRGSVTRGQTWQRAKTSR